MNSPTLANPAHRSPCPAAELEERYWFDFTDFAEDDNGIAKPKKFFDDIRKIAEYIVARYHELDALLGDTPEFLAVPDAEDARKFVATLEQSLKAKPQKSARK